MSEQIILRINPSMKPVVAIYAFYGLLIFALLIPVLILSGNILFVLPIDMILVGFAVAYHWKRNKTHYVLTNQNLTIEQGIISKSATHIPLHKVQDITVNRTLIDRIFNLGTIVVESAGSAGRIPEINVDSPEVICSKILEQVNSAKAQG